ncbi:hypothetical protein CRUP_023371 [Coryphaenoides rupestris]|nr:hypothetical protein CRUP_023371 [Coryphaenoides rupestris]
MKYSLRKEKARGRRVGVLETDSDYVKLAKQGGQKGLLWHEETQVSKPVQYTPANWFGSDQADDNGNQRSFDKKPPPVTMSKLLSFGYVEEEKATPGRKLSK